MNPKTHPIIQAFHHVARPIMLQYFGGDRRTCIASTRVTIETMKALGLDAQPVALKICALCPTLNYAYISGFSNQERRHMARQTKKPIQTVGAGYNGHVVAAVMAGADRWLLDTSIDQIESAHNGLRISPSILVIPIDDPHISLKHIRANLVGTTDSGQRLEIHYRPLADYSFTRSDAWEYCAAMKLVVTHIVAAMRRAPS